jgi:hypothetical protein
MPTALNQPAARQIKNRELLNNQRFTNDGNTREIISELVDRSDQTPTRETVPRNRPVRSVESCPATSREDHAWLVALTFPPLLREEQPPGDAPNLVPQFNPNSGVAGIAPAPGVAGRAFASSLGRRDQSGGAGEFRARHVFREGADNRARGGCAPFSISEFGFKSENAAFVTDCQNARIIVDSGAAKAKTHSADFVHETADN